MKRYIVSIALLFCLVIASVSCASGGGLKILDQNLTVHEFSGGGPQSVAIVHGRAQNVTNTDINSATISVNFYDKDKKLIATGSAVKQNLRPNDTWEFSVQTIGPDAWKVISYDLAVHTK